MTFQEQSRLDGRLALVTGAAGALGRELSNVLAELGANLLLVDRDGTDLGGLADTLGTYSVDVQARTVDLENEEARSALCRDVVEQNESLHILVNNAAFVGQRNLRGWAEPLHLQAITTWRRALEVNLTACFHLSQQLAPALEASNNGTIVNVGSIYGVVGPVPSLYEGTNMNNPAAYAASKGGLIQLTKWLATTLAPHIRVNCVSPGGIARGQATQFVERYVERAPMQRMATEQDIVGAIAFLSGDHSSYITGQNIVIDGGWTAW